MKKVRPKIHSGHIEVAVAMLLNYRVYTIVPNVSHGLGLNHECDMLALDSQGRFTEIEIKCSVSDLKADFKKYHGHKSKFISRLIYAVPEYILDKYSYLIPSNCGIILIESKLFKPEHTIWHHTASWYRQIKHDKTKEKPDNKTVLKFMSLGCMRIWSLKAKNNNR